VRERLLERLGARVALTVDDRASSRLARELRGLLDARSGTGLTLADAAGILHSEPTHLVRSFSREFGISPHRYLVGRRIENARRLLLAGTSVVDAAIASGFYDQAHLTRHFVRFLGVAPGRYARARA
jgi:AraC-like DNA-binding protein